jgi:biopolymer transport protein ExbD
MRFQRNVKPFTGQLDAAPLLGVFFLLLFFVLLNTPLAPPRGLRLRLPAVTVPEDRDAPIPSLVISIDPNNLVYFENQAVRDDELRSRLTERVHREKSPIALLIQADGAVQQATVVRLAALARAAGVGDIVIGTRPAIFPASTNRNAPP